MMTGFLGSISPVFQPTPSRNAKAAPFALLVFRILEDLSVFTGQSRTPRQPLLKKFAWRKE
jgi:hypothetical protein